MNADRGVLHQHNIVLFGVENNIFINQYIRLQHRRICIVSYQSGYQFCLWLSFETFRLATRAPKRNFVTLHARSCWVMSSRDNKVHLIPNRYEAHVTHRKSPESSNATMLRQWHVLDIVPVSQATLKRWVRAGKFPAPIKLSENVSAWRAADVHAWVDAQAAS